MSTQGFENYANSQLEGYRSSIDAEALWDSIEPQVRPEKRRRRFAWWWFGVALGAALFVWATASYFSSPNGNASNEVAAVAIAENTTERPTTNQEGQSALATNDQVDQQSVDKIVESNFNKNEKTQVIAPAISIKQKGQINNVKNNSKASKQKATSAIINLPPSIPNLNVTAELKEPQKQAKNTVAQAQAQAISEEKETLGEGEAEELIESEQEIPTEEIKEEAVEKVIAAELQSNDEKVVEEIEDEVLPNAMAEEDRRRFSSQFTIGIGARGGIATALHSISAKEPGNSPMKKFRDSSETALETLDFGLEVLLKSKIGLYLSTGIDYQQSARRMNYDDKVVVVDSMMGPTTIYINPISGTQDTVFGYLYRTTTTTETKEYFNRIRMVNIPVNIGYSFGFDEWSFGLEAGALFNISTSVSGLHRIGSYDFYDVTADENKWYKKNVGISFRGAIMVGYMLDNNLQLYAGPNFRSPVILDTDSNPIAQKHGSIGLQVGARYWLD